MFLGTFNLHINIYIYIIRLCGANSIMELFMYESVYCGFDYIKHCFLNSRIYTRKG